MHESLDRLKKAALVVDRCSESELEENQAARRDREDEQDEKKS